MKKSLAKDKMPLSLTFLRNCFEDADNDKYEKLDDMLIQELSDYDIRYIGFIVGDKKAGKYVEENGYVTIRSMSCWSCHWMNLRNL